MTDLGPASGAELNGYDPRQDLPDTMVMTVARELALVQAFQANGFQPLSPAQVLAAVGPAPPAVTSLPVDPSYGFDDGVSFARGTRYADVSAS